MPSPVPSFDGLFLACIAAYDNRAGDLHFWGESFDGAPAVHAPRRLVGMFWDVRDWAHLRVVWRWIGLVDRSSTLPCYFGEGLPVAVHVD